MSAQEMKCVQNCQQRHLQFVPDAPPALSASTANALLDPRPGNSNKQQNSSNSNYSKQQTQLNHYQ
jgi:hypothetical protein